MLTETVAGRTYDYSYNVGRGSQTGMGFNNPVALTLGADGVAYVVNRGSESISNVAWNRTGIGQRIGMVTLGAERGEEEYVGEFSRYGSAEGQLIWPTGIVADQQGNLYVTDEWLNRVSAFDSDGNFLRCWETVQSGDSEPNGAAGIAIDANDMLFVTDGRSHKVRKFSTDGTFLGSWGSLGSGDGELDSPWGITVDDEGDVYVADYNNHRVQKFTADGDFVCQIGTPGTKKGQLSYPTDVAVDPDGDIYICDWSKNKWDRGRIQIFDAEGHFLTALMGDAQQLSLWAEMTVAANADYLKRRREVPSTEPEWTFAQPTGVEFDAANNRLLVMDTQRSRIQIYTKQSGYMVPQLNL
ncbi:MAG: NHL repeat-containing protein [Candidatus Tectomicrobia bacterium]|nr:NHL repeat-containing protein [Candidatus Tectomicrobia bacterium]